MHNAIEQNALGDINFLLFNWLFEFINHRKFILEKS